jgi:hypothetical protein
MFERILGGKNRGRALSGRSPSRSTSRALLFPAGASCGAGCAKTHGYRCAYRDQAGNRCGWWCEDHSVTLNGHTWCQRHANVVKWLDARDGTIFEILNVPHIGDRSPNLAGILVDELDAEVVAYLTACFGHVRGVQVVTDKHVRASSIPKGRVERTSDAWMVLSEGSHVAWARGWGVFSEVGYHARIIIQATGTEPPFVHVYVNGNPVLSRVPDWIANRRAGTDQAEDRARFKGYILQAIRASVRAAELD